ncbi:MAG: adenylosuccinate lyase [Spirochaetes bacterium]|nr:adenylosuccinate lyase [Spirochaetota bacterium]
MSIIAISPIDGRYQGKTAPLSEYFSEKALIKYRILVECSYLEQLTKTTGLKLRLLTDIEKAKLANFHQISDDDAEIVKLIETQGYHHIPATNHDVKAIEYFIKLKLKKSTLSDLLEMVHFCLTSEDINNLSYALMLRDSINQIILPTIEQLYQTLYQLALDTKDSVMLARTHGQPASPTTFGKEILVFIARLKEELITLKNIPVLCKLNGATGNYNAMCAAYPEIDWPDFTQKLIAAFDQHSSFNKNSSLLKNVYLSLQYNPVTTQIEPHDSYCRIFDTFKRINTILIDFSQDIWRYISDNLIIQKAVAGEIGSSAMPHKVNPIDFENAEGNLGLANALFQFFSQKLAISRLQRDLSDSTVLRNIGTAFAHCLIACQSLQKGLTKIQVNKKQLLNQLKETPQVIAEAYQTILRAAGITNPYELLKDVTRGKKVTITDFEKLADNLEIEASLKIRLKSIRPENYTGIAAQIVENFVPEID